MFIWDVGILGSPTSVIIKVIFPPYCMISLLWASSYLNLELCCNGSTTFLAILQNHLGFWEVNKPRSRESQLMYRTWAELWFEVCLIILPKLWETYSLGFIVRALILFSARWKYPLSSKDLAISLGFKITTSSPATALPPSAPLELLQHTPPQHLLSDSSFSLISGTGLSLELPLLL